MSATCSLGARPMATHAQRGVPAEPEVKPTLTRRQLYGALGALLMSRPLAAASAADSGTAQLKEVERIEQAYDSYAASYDELDGGVAADTLGFPALRQQLLQQARGEVLETAVGTGLNLPFYNISALISLTAIDISSGMLGQARQRAAQLGLPTTVPLQLVQADVARLQDALNGRTFDTVVDTFSLCVFPDPGAALKSMASCLRPGGTLLLLEHSRSSFGPLGFYQDITASTVAATGKGCRWNDNVAQLVREAGLEIEQAEGYLGGLIVSLVASKPT